jgi:uncharacterized protein (TIGR03083 family)
MKTEQPSRVEYLEAYEAVRARLADVIGANDANVVVPACPSWRVRDVLAHLAGLCEDWVTHRLDGYATEAWTTSHVARNTSSTCAEILQRWAGTMETFVRLGDDPIMGPPARWAFGDAVIHEADIRGALSAGRVPLDAVTLGLRGSVPRWRNEVLRNADVPTLHLRTPDGLYWWLGREDDPCTVDCETSVYEVFRALAGRRSAEQVRAWTWSSDPEPFIAAGLPLPFHWAEAPLSD